MSSFNIAAQITMIAWSLQELPGDRSAIEPILRRSIELAGIGDIQRLKILKSQGKSVFRENIGYALASSADVNAIDQQIKRLLVDFSVGDLLDAN